MEIWTLCKGTSRTPWQACRDPLHEQAFNFSVMRAALAYENQQNQRAMAGANMTKVGR